MKQPRITVIMPNLNRGHYLERAICSVLDQGYDDLEFYVIDGGSTDDSIDILRLYENELTGWISEPDTGCAEAINKGISRATGDIVAYLSSEDIFLPGTLIEVAKRMAAPDRPQWVIGQSDWINHMDELRSARSNHSPRSFSSFLMRNSGRLTGAASFWDRRLIDAYGPFDSQMLGFDYEYSCRLLADGVQPIVMSESLVARREQPGPRSASETVRRGLDYLVAAARYSHYLPWAQRYALWLNRDTRQRIYTLAQAEMQGPSAKRFLWGKLMRHPWWISNNAVLHGIVHGMDHLVPLQESVRPAA